MRNVVIVRTLNEERNIAQFIESYLDWIDLILVADGGSTDRTEEIAQSYPKTEVKFFLWKKEMNNNLWRNPEAAHINFLIEWAESEGADWIFFDDCDCFPNFHLKRDILKFINTEFNFIYAVRLYLWGMDQHFPKLAQPGKLNNWETSMWAWKTSEISLRFHDTDMSRDFEPVPEFNDRINLFPPYALMHYAWPTEEVTQKKLDFYRNSGQIPGMLHPLEFGGRLEPLPEWARLEE